MKKQSLIRSAAAVGVAALALTACATDGDAGADEFPTRSLEILVPFGAGGSTDVSARAFAAAFEDELGERVLVVNRPGAGGAIGVTEASQSDADGYSLLLAPGSAFATVPLLQDVSYDASDFHSFIGLIDQPYAIIASADGEITTLDELAAADRRVTYTTFGAGHATHLAMANTVDSMGVVGEAVPYDSASEALQAVIGGQVDFGVIDVSISGSAIRSGSVVALAMSSDQPHPSYPDVPALGESAWPEGAGYISRISIAAPAGVDPAILEILEDAAIRAFESDSYQEFLNANDGIRPEFMGADFLEVHAPEMRDRVERDFERLNITVG